MNILDKLMFWIKTGAQIEDLGKIDDHIVIKVKDYYIGLMEKDGEIVNFAWSKDPMMFPDVPVREFYKAERSE